MYGRPEDVLFAVKKMEATSARRTSRRIWSIGRSYFTSVNPLLLPSLSPTRLPFHLNMTINHSSALDCNGVYDKRQEKAQSVSATLPSNVTLAPLPTAREAEVFPITKNKLLKRANRMLPSWSLSKLLTRLP